MPRRTPPPAPSERLQRLTLGERATSSRTSVENQASSMVRTRSGAGEPSADPEVHERGAGSVDSDSSTTDDESEDEMVGGDTDPGSALPLPGSTYDYEQMTPRTEERARRAFDADELSISHCRTWELDEATYFNFNLWEQIGIRIGPPDGAPSTTTCTCGLPSPCKHIWWLEYQLVQARDPRRNWSFVEDGSTISGIPLHQWILKNGIDRLCASGAWPLVPEAAELGDDFSQRRDEELSDMLTPFAPSPQDETSYRSAYDALDQAVRDVAESDRGIFERLRTTLDPELCALVRFDKGNRRKVERAFAALDLFSRIGPISDVSPHAPVSNCADILEEAVTDIEGSLRSNLEPPFTRIALSILLQIIQGVVTRNTDIFVGKPWASQVQAPTDQRDRNLYVRLVRAPPPSPQLFMVDVLRQFPPDALQDCRDTVLSIMDQVKRNGGPDRYYAALRDLIAPRAPPPGKGIAAGRKRGGDAGEGSSQPKRGR